MLSIHSPDYVFTVLISIFIKIHNHFWAPSQCYKYVFTAIYSKSVLPLLAHAHCEWYVPRTYERTYASSTMSRHSGAKTKINISQSNIVVSPCVHWAVGEPHWCCQGNKVHSICVTQGHIAVDCVCIVCMCESCGECKYAESELLDICTSTSKMKHSGVFMFMENQSVTRLHMIITWPTLWMSQEYNLLSPLTLSSW